jgi:hypothetical protein
VQADLPVPPAPTGLGWLGVVGPGVIVLGASIGSGEFLLGPAVFVRYGLSLLWVTTVAVVLQTIFNTEVMRYTLATGEPVFTGFMRTRPSSTAWAWFYVTIASLHLLYVNTRLLPPHVRPSMWRCAALVGVAAFYGIFVTLSLRSVWG